jgi:hypothetical protein
VSTSSQSVTYRFSDFDRALAEEGRSSTNGVCVATGQASHPDARACHLKRSRSAAMDLSDGERRILSER